jgi:iron complex outermembrane receptor protein
MKKLMGTMAVVLTATSVVQAQDTIQRKDSARLLEPLEVKSIRASDKAPFAKTNLSKADIDARNYGQDIPFILNQTPSIVVNSDAGTGIGYTAMRIRGTDATRINVTLNGIPYNDAESQGTFFVNLPDFATSVNSLQIQRGVGTSSNGAGAFGATINMSTNEVTTKAYAEVLNNYGSFNSWRNAIRVGSGLINNHFTFDARLSRITSDGYVDRASSNLESFYTSAAYIGRKSSLRLNVFSGKEKTYQAWNGVLQDSLKTHRTYNSTGTEKPGTPYDNETDNYRQTHYQLFFNQEVNAALRFSTAFFLTRGLGYYEQYKAARSYSSLGLNNLVVGNDTIRTTDIVRQLWLDNYFYGQILSLQYTKAKDEVTFGGGWNRYDGKHYGKVIWAEYSIPKDYRWYNLTSHKTDVNIYAKWLHSFNNKWSTFADLQYRRVGYTMNGFRDNPTLFIRQQYDFLNPKGGISYHYNGINAFASYAMANKEPNRDDFEAGVTQQPRREQLHDFEAGLSKRTARYSVGVTLYYMLYKDQLVNTGRINDVGAYTRQNVPNSYRTGIEAEAGYVFARWINVSANATFSRNKIRQFTEFLDNWDAADGKQATIQHSNTDIAFSPAITAAGTLNIVPVKALTVSLLSKYVGRQYFDNTQNKARSTADYYVQDATVQYQLPLHFMQEVSVRFQVNNVFNRRYEPNGYTYPYIYNGQTMTDNYYYPMAGTNYMVGLNVRF